MSSTSLTIEQRLDRLYTRSQANGATASHDPHSGILDWRPASSATSTTKSPPAPLLKKARHRPRSDDPGPKVDEAAIAKLNDDQITKIFAEMNDLGGVALSPVVVHAGCARSRQFVPALQKTSFEEALKVAQSSRKRLDPDHDDDDSSGLDETDDDDNDDDAANDDDKTAQAGAVGGTVCAPLPEERPVKTSSPDLRKTMTVHPMDVDDDEERRRAARSLTDAAAADERQRSRRRSRSPPQPPPPPPPPPPDRRKPEQDRPPAPPRHRGPDVAAVKVACSPSAATATSASPSLGTSMESPTVGQSNQSQLVQQSAKWKDAVKLKRLADKMKREAPLSEGWHKRQEMYMSAGLKFLEAAEMFSCAHSFQKTAQYFDPISQMYLGAGCHFYTSLGYECSAVARYRAMQVKRKDLALQANQLLHHVRVNQTRGAADSEPLTFPLRLGEMLSSYLRQSKCVWDYMDDWDKAKAYRPAADVLRAHNLEVLESLDDLDIGKFVEHVRRALSSSFAS